MGNYSGNSFHDIFSGNVHGAQGTVGEPTGRGKCISGGYALCLPKEAEREKLQ